MGQATELRGVAAAPGVAIGQIVVLDSVRGAIPRRAISPAEVPDELERLDRAIEASREQVQRLLQDSGLSDDLRSIFEAQMLILEDPMLIDETREKVRTRSVNVEQALADEIEILKNFLLQSPGTIFRERASDLEDMGNRLLSNLLEVPEGDIRIPELLKLDSRHILVASDLSPSLMLHLPAIGGLALEEGGVTGHMAILARSRGLPAVVQVEGLLAVARDGMEALIDAESGLVALGQLSRAHRKAHARYLQECADDANRRIHSPVKLARGDNAVELWVNLSDLAELDDPRIPGASGVGLFRTEFLYLKDQQLLASLPAQTDAYDRVLSRLGSQPVTFRLLDAGDDKPLPAMGGLKERHQRGVRLLLANPELLRVQFRALLLGTRNAGVAPENARLMIPMVSRLEEVHAVRALLCEAAEGLDGIEWDRHPLGVMLETPAALLMCDVLSVHVDFFSIGSNDLAQSCMGLNREFESSADELFYQPALYRLIHQGLKLARRPVSLCGNLAGRPELIGLLVGLGLTQLSVPPTDLFRCADVIKRLSVKQVQALAERALGASTAEELRSILKVRDVAPV
ncbi:MAG: phosphoenolpyruvate--protein phosphotransferase [Spirochaetales bacterium]|nr:phosphoenolpyruvate--protein phosphotransferase [Spirochaetales bacterium]MCP5486564.1 phosphoenolpyruvate--protein phosphotransferase [Spirochaetales bacterium]